MLSHKKTYWVLEILNRLVPVGRKHLSGKLSEKTVSTILQRLASRRLTPLEIIAASIPETQVRHFDVVISHPPHGKRATIWLPQGSMHYRASRWREDELENCPEILPEEW